MVHQVANGARRILVAPVGTKKSLTSQNIRATEDHFISDGDDISDLQVVTLTFWGWHRSYHWMSEVG